MNTRMRRIDAIVIGASAGGVQALSELLPALPLDLHAAVVIVLHLAPGRQSQLASVLQFKCSLPLMETQDKEPLEGGRVYVAPPDYHLLVDRVDATTVVASLSIDEPLRLSRPSIDVLFESAADAWGAGLLGIVLTGANDDGARGLAAIIQAGGQAWVQSPEHAQSPQMPQAAIAMCPQARVLTLTEMARSLAGLGEEACA